MYTILNLKSASALISLKVSNNLNLLSQSFGSANKKQTGQYLQKGTHFTIFKMDLLDIIHKVAINI